jgi:hypothetical protein
MKKKVEIDGNHFLYQTAADTNTGLFKMIVGVLTTCHTQYT